MLMPIYLTIHYIKGSFPVSKHHTVHKDIAPLLTSAVSGR